ncbi:MAG: four helix bundle protein [Thermodesulfovibrionia bacterium]|nr:four helix bundle protein [Thermodesulfovibrionia bacterium]
MLKINRVRGVEDSGDMLKNYKDLKVWQKSYQLCLEIYKITKEFPKEERYGLISQIRRVAVSVPSIVKELNKIT